MDLNNLFDIYNKKYFENKLEKIDIVWNNRIYRTIGRYIKYRDNKIKPRIEISKKYIEYYPEEITNILVHEMIHHKYPEEKHSKIFIKEMNRLNIEFEELNIRIKSNQSIPGKYKYICSNKKCNSKTERNKKVNLERYVCGKCGSKILLENMEWKEN